MTHIMFDLETMDTEPSTVILSIGAVEFRPEEGIVDKKGGKLWFPAIGEQLEEGRTISESTLIWWLKQGEDPRREVYGARRSSKKKILEELQTWILWLKTPLYVWGNGSIFDIAILEHWMNYTKIPWAYYNVRDTRTLWHVHPYDKNEDLIQDVPHRALEDAIGQAEKVCEVWPKK